MDPMKRLLFWLLEGTKGGPTRIALLSLLSRKPMNTRQLALAAGLDYKTVEHHITLLQKNGVIDGTGADYGKVYFVSETALAQEGFAEMIRGENNGVTKKK